MKFGQRLAILPLTLVVSSLAMPALGLELPTTSDRGATRRSVGGATRAIEFPETSDRGAPSRTAGGATRGSTCIDATVQPNLTSLLPNNSLATTYGADADLPTSLFFYVPESPSRQGELFIVNSTGEEVYSKTVPLPDEAGIIQVEIADGATLFEAEELYYWDFSIVCDVEDPDSNVVVGGGIQRADASAELLAALAAAGEDPLAQAQVYADARAWQETLALVAQIRDDNSQPWDDLLESVGLEAVADAPLLTTGESHAAADCE